MAIVIELDLYALPAGPLQTRRYVSGESFTTRPSDSPPNHYIEGRIAGLQVFRRDLFERATTFGVMSPGRGVITLLNPDGALDELATGFVPRAVRMYYAADVAAPYPVGWVPVGVAQVTRIEADKTRITLQLADRLAALDRPLLPATYAGDNALPNGLEGVDDLKGQRKPRVLGSVLNISPLLVNSSKLIWQLSDQPANVSAVYDGGALLAAGAAYASTAELQATAPAAGQYRVYSGASGCYLRTGSMPARQITVDASAGETRAAQLAANVATAMSVTVDAADLAALNAITAPVGVWVTDGARALDVIAELLGSIGAWAGFDAFGVLRMARLLPPDADPAVVLQPWWLRDVALLPTADDDAGRPVWRVALGYARNGTVQGVGELAGGSVARAAFTAQEYRQAVASDPGRQIAWPDAPEHVANTALLAQADAEAEAARRLALYSGRQLYEVRLDTNPDTAAIALGATVRLAWPRWGLATGKNLRVIGITRNDGNTEITLRLWG